MRSSVVLDFDESISVVVGQSITLTTGSSALAATFGANGIIYNTDSTLLQIGTYSVGSGMDSDKLTIDWSADFDLGASYSLQIAAGAVTDLAGNVFPDVTATFRTVAAETTVSPVSETQVGSSSGSMTTVDETLWVEITSYGSAYNLDTNKSYVLVIKDVTPDDPLIDMLLNGSFTDSVTIAGFGADDKIYFDIVGGSTFDLGNSLEAPVASVVNDLEWSIPVSDGANGTGMATILFTGSSGLAGAFMENNVIIG